jgi:guanylate kinase
MIKKDEFVEWKNVHGNFYGTSKKQIRDTQASKKIPLLDIDIQGTETFLESFPESNTLFLFPPSTEILEQRLRSRGTDKEEDIQMRLSNARTEISRGLDQEDPKALIGYRLINGNLEESKPAFLRIIEGLYYQELPEA